jgi:hypothetical protein
MASLRRRSKPGSLVAFPSCSIVSRLAIRRHDRLLLQFQGNLLRIAWYRTGSSVNSRLFLDQGTLKDRSGIKASLIGPPEALSVFIFFLNW